MTPHSAVLQSSRHNIRGFLLFLVAATCLTVLFYCNMPGRPTGDVSIRAIAEAFVPPVRAPGPAVVVPSENRTFGQRRNVTDRPTDKQEERRGDYVVLRNALTAQVVVGRNDSVTFTTHSTIEQLDNLLGLVRKWDGPLSVALYAPRDDFRASLRMALWLRRCHKAVADAVTFHFVYPAPGVSIWLPDRPPWSEPVNRSESTGDPSSTPDEEEEAAGLPYDYRRVLEEVLLDADPTFPVVPCSAVHPVTQHPSGRTYRQRHGLSMPINVCRNVARLTATTRYVLAADIELFPSAGVVDRFLEFVGRRNDSEARRRRVYVLPHFEVHDRVTRVPSGKRALAELYRRGLAVDFHKYRMAMGHVIPKVRQWMELPVGDGRLDVFMTVKRERPFTRWEPFYIGTNDDPTYTETLTWEGQQNKLTQMFEICLLNYELAILDGAFLVHRPGIKRRNASELKYRLPFIERNRDVYKEEVKKLEKKHGANPNCQ